MNQIRLRQWSLLALGAAVCLGCNQGPQGPKTYAVTGTVTLDGAPAEGVTVSFISDGGDQGAVGVTDATGTYTLTTRVKDDGAIPGRYKVTFAKYEGGANAVTDPSQAHADYDISNEYAADYDESAASSEASASANVLPARYANPATSEATAEVVAGPNTHNFELSSS